MSIAILKMNHIAAHHIKQNILTIKNNYYFYYYRYK